MRSGKRWRALQIIYDYLVKQHLDRVEVTAVDIVSFYQLPRRCSHVLAVMMKYVHESKKAIHGFRVTRVQRFRRKGHPKKYTIELV